MNNEGFQKMVRDRTSTKAFARAAVEAEFKRKKKKRKRGGSDDDYLSDSDDERGKDRRRGAAAKSHNTKEEQESDKASSHLMFRPQQVKETSEQGGESKYRDRAKERRENIQPVQDDGLFDELLTKSDMSDSGLKSKGLDLTLVRKAKQELAKDDTPTAAAAAAAGESFEGETASGDATTSRLPTKEEATLAILKFAQNPSMIPSLSTGLYEYLTLYAELLTMRSANFSKTASSVACGRAGKVVQQTRLAFAMDGQPSDRLRAWEIPRPLVNSATKDYSPIPVVNDQLLQSIDEFCQRRSRNRAYKATFPNRSLLQTTEPPVDKKIDPLLQEKKQDNMGVDKSDDDDDDDIFGGLDDYIPPKKMADDASAET